MSVEKLNEFFNIEPSGRTLETKDLAKPDADYDFAKQNLYEIIGKSKIALDGILKVAAEGDSPRAYEVVTQMLKTMSEINKDLLELENIKAESNKTTIKSTTNNSFFIGSTSDLQDLINPERSKKKALDIIDVEVKNVEEI